MQQIVDTTRPHAEEVLETSQVVGVVAIFNDGRIVVAEQELGASFVAKWLEEEKVPAVGLHIVPMLQLT